MISSAGALKNVVALAVGFVAGLKHDEQVRCDATPSIACVKL
jgi:glycerol-3-phosphate dehydrogenase